MTLPTPDNTPGTGEPASPKTDSGSSNPIAAARQWLIDTYNGLYVIVLKPRMPEGILYAVGIIGLLMGLLWAYAIVPTEFVGANPNRLNEGAQSQWILMTAVGAFPEAEYADETAIALASAVPNPRETIQMLLQSPETSPQDRQALQNLLNILPADVSGTPAPAGSLVNSIISFVVAIVVTIIVIVVVVLLWRFLIYDNIVAPVLQRIQEARDPELAARNQRAREELKIQQEQRRMREEMQREATGSELGEPVMQNLAIYSPGRQFDESYEIELATGEFLGQSGAVLSETVDPDPVAVEVWLFDMFSQQNLTKVFVTPQANNDPGLRSRIENGVDNPATDIIVAQPGAQITLDSDKIRLQAKLSSVDFDANGRFQNFNMQVRAWQKDGVGSTITAPSPAAPPPPTPTGAPPMSTYDDMQFDPPPVPPSSSGARPMTDYDDMQFDPPPVPPAQPSGGQPSAPQGFGQPMGGNQGMPPLQPPPLRQPPRDDDDDDDPFGGTGDFTPLPGR